MSPQFIKINNAIVRNREISDNAKLIFSLFLSNKRNGEYNIFCTNISNVIHMLNGKYNTTSIKGCKKSLKEIVNLGMVTLFEDMECKNEIEVDNLKASNCFYLDINNEFIESKEFLSQFEFCNNDDTELTAFNYKSFTGLYISDFVRFVNYEFPKNINKLKLFSTYLIILSRANIDLKNINSTSNISYEKIKNISDNANATEKSVTEYIKVLCSEKFIFKVTISTVKNRGISKRNIFSRYRDRHCIFRAMDTEISGFQFKHFLICKVNNTEITQEQSSEILKTVLSFDGKTSNDIVDKHILQKLLINF